jgi:GLTT repeat (6 copies)
MPPFPATPTLWFACSETLWHMLASAFWPSRVLVPAGLAEQGLAEQGLAELGLAKQGSLFAWSPRAAPSAVTDLEGLVGAACMAPYGLAGSTHCSRTDVCPGSAVG